MDLSNIRKNYAKGQLNEKDVALSPFDQFEKWMQEALHAEVLEPTAMVLSTVSAEGKPSSRTVLLKQFDKNGFVFFTNYESRKAEQIALNPWVAAAFFWKEIEKQILVEGKAEKITSTESAAYFASRPRQSQLAAWASPQSKPIVSRETLEENYYKMEKIHEGDVPLPFFWGGYRIVPERFEFWQGRSDRLHDRFCYLLDKNTWVATRLAP